MGSNLGTLHQGLRQAHSPKQELCARCLHHAICAILCAKRSAPLFAPSDLRHRFTYVRKGQERGVLTAVTGRGTATTWPRAAEPRSVGWNMNVSLRYIDDRYLASPRESVYHILGVGFIYELPSIIAI